MNIIPRQISSKGLNFAHKCHLRKQSTKLATDDRHVVEISPPIEADTHVLEIPPPVTSSSKRAVELPTPDEVGNSAPYDHGPNVGIQRKVRSFNDIPGPSGLPFLGTLLDYKFGRFAGDQYHSLLHNNSKKYGSIYKEKFRGETKLHIFDPVDVRSIYDGSEKLPDTTAIALPSKYYRQLRKMSPGLGNTNGEEWYRLRSAVQPIMLRPQSVTSFFPLAMEVIDDFIIRIKSCVADDGQLPNIMNELRRWNIESSYNTFMETRLGCLRDDMDDIYQKMIDANPSIFESTVKLGFSLGLYRYFSTPTWMKHVKLEDVFFKQGMKVLDKALDNMKDLTDKGQIDGRYIFLTQLLQRTSLSLEEVRTLSVSFTFDGLNATVPTLAFIWYCLAANPDKQQKLHEEITKVLPNKNVPITPETLGKMTYLKACIKETLRLFPNGTEITRVSKKDTVVKGYHIPAGTIVDLHMPTAMKDPDYVQEADSFIPERWLRNNEMAKFKAALSIPFGFGTRMCIGRRISEQEMQLLTVKLLQNYRLEWPHTEKLQQRFQILMFPSRDPDFKFIARS